VTKKKLYSEDEEPHAYQPRGGNTRGPGRAGARARVQPHVSPRDAPDEETLLEIDFKDGNPVSVRNLSDAR